MSYRRIAQSVFLTSIFVILGISTASAERTYNNPRWGDNRLDNCLTWGRDCGQPVADRYCNRKKYRRASRFESRRIGDAEPTQLIFSNTVCRGSFCTALMSITCDDPYPDSQVFVNPSIDGYRLDNCRVWANECGRPAADAFCREMGFGRAAQDFVDADPGYADTKVISNRQVCHGSFCKGFQMIICE